jgi:MFS family permease
MPRALFPAIATLWFASSGLEPATIVGLLTAAIAVGGVMATVLSGSFGAIRRHGLAVVLSIVVWGSSIALFGFSRWLPLSLLLLAIAGGADTVSAIFRNTILQAASPDEYRGRLGGVFTVVVNGGPKLGDVESGGMAALAGETFSVVSGGVLCLVATAALVAAIPQFLRYDARHPTP